LLLSSLTAKSEGSKQPPFITIMKQLHLSPSLKIYFPKVSYYFAAIFFSVSEVSVFVSFDKYRIKVIKFSLSLHAGC